MLRVSFLVALILSLFNYIAAECPNACSAHGKCGAYDMCQCYPNWMASDCSERKLNEKNWVFGHFSFFYFLHPIPTMYKKYLCSYLYLVHISFLANDTSFIICVFITSFSFKNYLIFRWVV